MLETECFFEHFFKRELRVNITKEQERTKTSKTNQTVFCGSPYERHALY